MRPERRLRSCSEWQPTWVFRTPNRHHHLKPAFFHSTFLPPSTNEPICHESNCSRKKAHPGQNPTHSQSTFLWNALPEAEIGPCGRANDGHERHENRL